MEAFPGYNYHMTENRTPSWHNIGWTVGVHVPPTLHQVGLGVGALLGCQFWLEFVGKTPCNGSLPGLRLPYDGAQESFMA